MYALERKGLRDTSAVQAVVSKTLGRGLPLFFKNAVLGLELVSALNQHSFRKIDPGPGLGPDPDPDPVFTDNLFKQTLKGSRFTLSRAYKSCLACQSLYF